MKTLILLLAMPALAGEHPLINAYPGSSLDKLDVKEFDEYVLPLGQINSGRHVKTQELEGKVTVINYRNPPQRSTLELMRNYENALKAEGFSELYSCKGHQCGSGCVDTKGIGFHCANDEDRYLAARLPRSEGDAYVALLVSENETHINVVEIKPMENRLGSSGSASAATSAAPSRPAAASEAAPATPSGGSAAAAKGPDEVETGIVQGLTGFGFQAKKGSAEGASADIVVEGKVTTSPLDAVGDKRWRWARSSVTVSIKDGRTGKTFVRFDASDRQASADYNEAVRRSHVALGKKVAEQVKTAIADYFENQ